jgi:UDP-glucose 4-epimerase
MAVDNIVERIPQDIQATFAGKRVLITGGLGFIGSNLVQALVPIGAKVIILDALLEPYGGNTFNIAEIADRVEVVDGNILDQPLVEKLVAGTDYIFHLAGQVGYVDAKDKPFVDLDYNGKGNLILLEAVRMHAPQAHILFSSSRLVYGKILTLPVTEEHPTNPLSLYGIHKLLGEKYYGYYANEYHIQGMSVRIPNPYGPRQQMKHSKYSIVGWFVRQALENKTIEIFGDGSQERDYIYISDIVDALLRVIAKGAAGEAYNIGSHERMRFVDMVDIVISAAGGGKKKLVPWPADYEKNETGDYVADIAKVTAATGWQPHVNFSDGIQEMVEYYKKNKEHYW